MERLLARSGKPDVLIATRSNGKLVASLKRIIVDSISSHGLALLNVKRGWDFSAHVCSMVDAK